MLRRTVSLKEFTSISKMLNTLRTIGLTEGYNYIIIWEQKPKLTINGMGEFEFENPQEVYGCVITFWDAEGLQVSRTKFTIAED